MSSTRPLYVALIPAWLADTLRRNNQPLESAMSFSKLETIVSFDDVCFYFDYLRNIRRFLGSMFDDMKTIDQSEANQVWLASKAGAVEPRIEATRRFYADPTTDLSGTQIPQVVRKTNYVPQALRDDCLAVVGVGLDTAAQFDLTNFVRAALLEMEKLRTWEDVKQTKLFLTHSQVATDAA